MARESRGASVIAQRREAACARSAVEGARRAAPGGAAAAALLPVTAALGALAGAPALAQAVSDAGPAIEQIVITAERRATTVQATSLAVQAIGGEEIERAAIRDARSLNLIVPGISVSGPSASQIYVRGVGDFSASPLANPAVGVSVDGVYVARPHAVGANFYDLERIEVLKGPQGTLYGRNTLGGAVNLVTRAPSLDGVEGYLQGEVGNYDAHSLEGAVNVPLDDSMAVRAAFLLNERDGYLTDGTNDAGMQAGRIRLLYRPVDAVSSILSFDYTRETGVGGGYVIRPRVSGDPFEGSAAAASNKALDDAQAAIFTPPFLRVPGNPGDEFKNNIFWNASLETDWDMGPVTLTVLPAYRSTDFEERNYPASLRSHIPDGQSEQISYEVRLASSGDDDRLDWVVGAFHLNEQQTTEQRIFQGARQDNIGLYTTDVKSYAAFGQGTLHVTDALRAIAGVRYTEETIGAAGGLLSQSTLVTPPGAQLPFLLEAFGGERDFSDTTWRAGLEYDLAESSMAYATASTGFKAGGFNQTIEPDATFEPEKLTAYEAGIKNDLLGGRLRANLELFYWRYEDAQTTHVKFDPAGQTNLITDNAGDATMKGASVEFEALATPSDRVRLLAEYNDSKFDSFVYDQAYSQTRFGQAPTVVFNPLSTGCDVSAPFAGPGFPQIGVASTQLVSIDCSGRPLSRAPEWSGSASYEHTFDLAGGGEIGAQASVFFAAERWITFDYIDNELVPSYATVDLDVTYTAPDGTWRLAGYLHNALDENVYTGGGESPFAPPLVYATIAPPQTYGLRLRYAY